MASFQNEGTPATDDDPAVLGEVTIGAANGTKLYVGDPETKTPAALKNAGGIANFATDTLVAGDVTNSAKGTLNFLNGTVTVGAVTNEATLNIGKESAVTMTATGLSNSADGVVNIAGGSSLVVANETKDSEVSNLGEINVNAGSISAEAVENKGSITLASGENTFVSLKNRDAGKIAISGAETSLEITAEPTDTSFWNTGVISVADGGSLVFSGGDLELDAAALVKEAGEGEGLAQIAINGGTLDVKAGKLTLNGEGTTSFVGTVSADKMTFADATTIGKDSIFSAKSAVDGNVTVAGTLDLTGNGGTISGTVSGADGGNINVQQGEWNVAADSVISVVAGALTIGTDATTVATLNVENAGAKLENTDGENSGSVTLKDNSKLNVTEDAVTLEVAGGTEEEPEITATSALTGVVLNSGATMTLDYSKNEIHFAEAQAIRNALVDAEASKGQFEFKDTSITEYSGLVEDGKVSQDDLMLVDPENTGDPSMDPAVRAAVVTDVQDDRPLNGTYAGVEMAPENSVVTTNDHLALEGVTDGSEQQNFVAKEVDGKVVPGGVKVVNPDAADPEAAPVVAVLGSETFNKEGSVDGVELGSKTGLRTEGTPDAVINTGDVTKAPDATETALVTNTNTVAKNINVNVVTGKQGTNLTAINITADTISRQGGILKADTVEATNIGLNMGNQAHLKDVSLNPEGQITVGGIEGDTGNTDVRIDKLALNGGKLYIDPTWSAAGDSNVVITNVETNVNVDGIVGVGRRAMLAYGTDDMGLLERDLIVATGGGLRQGGVEAALGVYKPITLAAGAKIAVSGGLSLEGDAETTAFDSFFADPNTATLTFADKSMLVVDAKTSFTNAAGETVAAITGPALEAEGGPKAKASIADGAMLHVKNVKAGKTYQVLDKATIESNLAVSKGWNDKRLTTDMQLISLHTNADGSVTAKQNSAREIYPDMDGDLAGLIDNGVLRGQINGDQVNSTYGGRKFLSRAVNYDAYLAGDTRSASKTIEGAARIISIGGVQQMALAANNAAGGAVVSRTSIGSLNTALISVDSQGKMEKAEAGVTGANGGDTMTGLNAGDFNRSGFAMWVMPLWQSVNHFGLKAGDFKTDMNGNLGGVALGADYTIDDMFRFGLTFNIGGGYAQGSGDFATTKNSMNFWGLGAYASYAQNNMGLTFDINYTSTFNKLKQEMDSRMAMGDLKTDLFAQALSLGLRGEYKFQLDALDILPHVGVRYTNLWTDDYTVKSGGDKIMKGDGTQQSIWTFPIGVQFSKDIATGNGWYVRPSLDLNITPAAGDIEAKNDIRFTGVSGDAGLKTQVMDYITYGGQAGIEFGNENIKVGVNYNLQVGAHTTNHGVFGTFRYEF